MIHAVYLKNKPKGKWQLFILTNSQERATLELSKAKEQAKLEGYENAEVGVQLYDSVNNIPEYLSNLKDHKILFN